MEAWIVMCEDRNTREPSPMVIGCFAKRERAIAEMAKVAAKIADHEEQDHEVPGRRRFWMQHIVVEVEQ